MNSYAQTARGIASVIAAIAFVMPIAAQQPAVAPTAPASSPTVKNPLRFTAFAINMETRQSGSVDIIIERWTTDAERKPLLDALAGATFKKGGQEKLLDALQKVQTRTGYIRTANASSLDLRYAYETMLPDGVRQIVVATDKPVGFLAASTGARVLDYPFTFVEIRMKPNQKGEGKLLAATAIATKNGKLELENYSQEPVRLNEVTQVIAK